MFCQLVSPSIRWGPAIAPVDARYGNRGGGQGRAGAPRALTAAAAYACPGPPCKCEEIHDHHPCGAPCRPRCRALRSPAAARASSSNSAAAPPAVTVAKPVQRTVVDQDEYVGRFVAVDSVEIRARVSGYLAEMHFTDGQMVKKGDLLFTIDRRPFQIALDQMRANLAQARANLAFTEADLAARPAARAQQDHHRADLRPAHPGQARRRGRRRRAGGGGASGRARSRQFTELRAPVDGRIGDRRVAVGNLVTGGTGGNTTLLATIVSVDPIRFEFTFDEASYLRYERFASVEPGRRQPRRQRAGRAQADRREGFRRTRAGWISSTTSSTAPPARSAAAPCSPTPTACSRPACSAASACPARRPIRRCWCPTPRSAPSRSRKFVLVVDADNVVRQKYVTLGQIDGGLRVIKDGLAADDRVIVNGLMRARPGPEGHAAAKKRSASSSADKAPQATAQGRKLKASAQCASRISSSTGRSSPRWSRSCS